MKYKYLFLLLFSITAHADSAYFKYGLSIGQPNLPSSKLFSFGYQSPLPRGMLLQLDCGIVNTPGYVDKLAVLVGTSFGVEVRPSDWARVQALWGPSFYSRKDAQLGGPMQFNHDMCLDLMDSFNFVGACYKHVSSAGIYKPNKGLDAIQFRLGIKF